MDSTGELSGVYRDGRHYDVLAQMTAPDDLPLYRALVEEHGGPVLELGCGTGRVALELAAAGTEVVGVDVAEPLLAWAREKTPPGAPVTWVHGDVRDLALERRFPLVLFPYNGFNHMLTRDDVRRCLACARAHLEMGGRIVIDTFQPDPRRLVPDGESAPILRYRDPDSGSEVVLHEQNAYDAASQVNTITWRYTDRNAELRTDVLHMRIFFPQELDALLEAHGLTVCDKWGDYDRRPFTSLTPKQLVVCRVD